MLFKELLKAYKSLSDRFRAIDLLNGQEPSLVDWKYLIANYKLKVLFNQRYKHLPYEKSFPSQNCSRSLGLIFFNKKENELNSLVSYMLKTKKEDAIAYFKLNRYHINYSLSLDNFKIIIKALNLSNHKVLMENYLTINQLKYLIDNYNLDCSRLRSIKKDSFHLNTLHNYIKANGRLSQIIILSLFQNGEYKKIDLLKVINSPNYLSLLKENPLFEQHLDKGIVLSNNKLLWKMKDDYVEINKISHKLVFRSLDYYDIDTEVKSQDYNFSKFFKNKLLIKKVFTATFGKRFLDPSVYRILINLKRKIPNIDEQLLIPLIDNKYEGVDYLFNDTIDSEHFNGLVKLLSSNYNIKRVLLILVNSKSTEYKYVDNSSIKDTLSMFSNLKKVSSDFRLKRKLKTIDEVHNFLQLELMKIKQENFRLNQELAYLNGQSIDSYKLHIPQTNHEIIEIGQKLHICVGNGDYSLQVLNKEIGIVAVLSDSNIVGCLEIKDNQVVQQKSFHNTRLKIAKEKIEDLIQKSK